MVTSRGQEIAPEAAGVDHAQEQLANRIGEQQAVGKVHQAVEMVALPSENLVQRGTEQRPCPGVVGDLAVGVVRAQGMQAEEQEDQAVGDARQR